MSGSELSFLLVVLVLPLVIGAAVLLATWGTTPESRTRRAVLGAVAGSVLLVIAAGFFSLCGLGENRSELFHDRCSGGTPELPLLGIPLLFLAAFGASRWHEGLFWALGALTLLVGLIVPWKLLDV